MLRYLIRRVIGVIPVLFISWSLIFFVLQLTPGDPVNLMLAGRPASEEVRENTRRLLGLDKPVHVRYINFLWKAVRGDLGDSYRTRQPVITEISAQLRPTLELAAGGLVIGLLFGVSLGVLSGIRPNSWWDTGAMVFALAGISMPSFWSAMLLIFFFGLKLGWFPIVGEGLPALVMPAFTTGFFLVGNLARLIRSSILEVMTEDYIRTGRAKGLGHWKVVFKHALRNAMIPPVTLLGVQFALLIGGAVITETVFARPGLGRLLVTSVLNKDFPMVQALVVYTTSAYIMLNLIVDVLYSVIDPRIRDARSV
ncbi:MAG: ABC transporter permease [Trueperaceae bacterium]|nr:MAG: ABC transporter permease [Trueperaceae bacterium]